VKIILEKVMDAIEQSKAYMMKGRHHLMSKLDNNDDYPMDRQLLVLLYTITVSSDYRHTHKPT
jgi:hypothetical protein